jgi:Ca2+:H+ antiporter
VARQLLWASLALTPLCIVLRFGLDVGDVPLFVFSAAALVPLAWLIGEATEHAAEHTGPGVGGFLNASFGNAPELIIALFAVNSGLPDVVRGSLTGSVVSNLLLVLGFALLLGGDRPLDRTSLMGQLAICLWAVALFLIPSVPGWHGDPNRYALAVASIPVSIALLAIYVGVTMRSLRRHRRLHLATLDDEAPSGWSLPASLAVLAVATGMTALVSEILVHSLGGFADAAGLSEFFVSAVIVAIVGNAAEHGGAVVIARRGKLKLASEIATSSAAQVALLVAPAVALLSWIVRPELSLAFRPIEIATMGGATLFVAAVVWDARGTRREGLVMLAAYVAVAIAYAVAGDR